MRIAPPSPLVIIVVAWLTIACHERMSAAADEAAKSESPVTDSDREHWAFRPIASPSVPHVGDTSWPRNPIDEFVLAALRAAELEPSPEADRTTLIRRVTLDLTG
jgi:hypothetical protein